MKSIVYNAKVVNNVAVGIDSTITGGVEIPDNKFVPPGNVITTQAQVDSLPSRIGAPFEKYNEGVIHVNGHLLGDIVKKNLKNNKKEKHR
jgi:carbonic anhydrase/acetyltransferase-like protein (isoleucine patch superfamily)